MTATVVYDAKKGFFDNPPGFCTAYIEWLEAHGVDKMSTYRTEHHLIDVPFVRVFQVDADEHGRRYYDPQIDDVAVRPPFDVLVQTPPPTPDEYRRSA